MQQQQQKRKFLKLPIKKGPLQQQQPKQKYKIPNKNNNDDDDDGANKHLYCGLVQNMYVCMKFVCYFYLFLYFVLNWAC